MGDSSRWPLTEQTYYSNSCSNATRFASLKSVVTALLFLFILFLRCVMEWNTFTVQILQGPRPTKNRPHHHRGGRRAMRQPSERSFESEIVNQAQPQPHTLRSRRPTMKYFFFFFFFCFSLFFAIVCGLRRCGASFEKVFLSLPPCHFRFSPKFNQANHRHRFDIALHFHYQSR